MQQPFTYIYKINNYIIFLRVIKTVLKIIFISVFYTYIYACHMNRIKRRYIVKIYSISVYIFLSYIFISFFVSNIYYIGVYLYIVIALSLRGDLNFVNIKLCLCFFLKYHKFV